MLALVDGEAASVCADEVPRAVELVAFSEIGIHPDEVSGQNVVAASEMTVSDAAAFALVFTTSNVSAVVASMQMVS